MNLKKKILGISATTALATVALVSCGGSKGPKTLTITLDGNAAGVTVGATDVKVKTADELVAALAEVKPTRAGYDFEGWYADAACKNKITASTDLASLKGSDGTYTVYANFKQSTATITLNYKGNATGAAGEGPAKIDTTVGAEVAMPTAPTKNATTKDGGEYSFKGWFTDEACTKAFVANTKAEKTMTLYAGWEIASISTVEEFKSYVNSNQTINAELTADIDFAGAELSRMKGDADLAGLLKDGTEFNGIFKNKFFGNGHAIKNMAIKTDAKGGSIWASLKTGAVIKDLSFVGCSFSNTNEDTAGFLAANVEGEVVIEDVVVDGFTGTMTKQNGILIGQAKNAGLDVSISGVVFNNVEITQSKAVNGAVIALVAQNAKGTIDIKDVVVNNYVLDGQKKGERSGFIIGNVKKEATNEITINVDGAVISGEIKDAKAIAAVAVSDGAAKMNVKNVVIADFKGTNYNDLNANTVVLKLNNATTADIAIENVVYRQYGLDLIGKDSTTSEMKSVTKDLQGTAATQAETLAATVSSNITVNAEAKAFEMTVNGTKYSVAVASDPAEVDVTAKVATVSSSIADIVTTDRSNVAYENTNEFRAKGTIQYLEAAVAGTAGNGFDIKITPNAEITKTAGRKIVSSDLKKAKVAEDGSITGYVVLTDEDVTFLKADANVGKNITKTVTVKWFSDNEEDAKNVEYKINITAGFCTVQAARAKGEIAAVDTELTAAVDTTVATKLNVTAGTIAYDSTAKGNVMEITVANPGLTVTNDKITVTGGTKVSYESGKVKIAVKVAAGDNTVSVKWGDAYDADTYTVNIGTGVTLAAKPTEGEGSEKTEYNVSFDATALALVGGAAPTISASTFGSTDIFELTGTATAKLNGDGDAVTGVELAKNSGTLLKITVTEACTLTLTVGSTGGSNKSAFGLKCGSAYVEATTKSAGILTPEDTSLAAGIYQVNGTTYASNTITYTLEANKTYELQSPTSTTATNGRGFRICTLTLVNAD